MNPIFIFIASLIVSLSLSGAEQEDISRKQPLQNIFTFLSVLGNELESAPSDVQSLIIPQIFSDDMEINPWLPLKELLYQRKKIAPVALQYNPDGTECIYATENSIEVCDTKTKKVSFIGKHKGFMQRIAYTTDPHEFIACSSNTQNLLYSFNPEITVYKGNTQKKTLIPILQDTLGRCIGINTALRYVALDGCYTVKPLNQRAYTRPTLDIIDVERKMRTQFLVAPVSGTTMSFSADGKKVAFPIFDESYKDNARLALYNLEKREIRAELYVSNNKWFVHHVVFNHQGTELAVLARNNDSFHGSLLWILDTNTAQINNTFVVYNPIAKSIAYSPDDKLLFIHNGSKVLVYNPHIQQESPGSVPIPLTDIDNDLHCQGFSTPLLLKIKNYNYNGDDAMFRCNHPYYCPGPLRELQAHSEFVTGFAPSPDGKHLALGYTDGIALVRRLIPPMVALDMTSTQLLFLTVLYAYSEPDKQRAGLKTKMLFHRNKVPATTFFALLDSFDTQTKEAIMEYFNITRIGKFQQLLKKIRIKFSQ